MTDAVRSELVWKSKNGEYHAKVGTSHAVVVVKPRGKESWSVAMLGPCMRNGKMFWTEDNDTVVWHCLADAQKEAATVADRYLRALGKTSS